MMRAIVRNARTLRVPPFRHSPTSTFCALSGHEVFSRSVIRQSSCRGAKTKASIKLKDLAQGRLGSLEPPLTATNDSPQYPSVIQGAKNNMLKFKNCVLLTRVGGFYELYLEQAEEFAPLLNLKLACKKTSGGSVPMAGFPFYQLDRFLKILVQDLQKYVAISEEFTNNITEKAKSGGLMFDRKVARIVTPGTLIDEKFMDHYENNFLLALYVNTSDMQKETKAMARPSPDQLFSSSHSHPVGLSWLDLSTGDFFTQYTTRLMLPSALSRIGAKEIILDERLNDSLKQEMQNLVGQDHRLLTCFRSQDIKPMSDWSECFETPIPRELAATFTVEETAACHILLEYVQVQMQGVGVKLQAPRRKHLEETMAIDRNSLKGLEILETARDGLGKGSLLHAVRRTSTKSGARLLRDRLTSPSASLPVINERLDLVSEFIEDIELEESITSLLKRSYDAQRLVQKFSLGRADADDILCLSRAIDASSRIRSVILERLENNKQAEKVGSTPRRTLYSMVERLTMHGPEALSKRILQTIDEEALLRKQRMEEEDAADAAALAHEVIANEGSPEDLESMPKRVKSQRTGKSKDLSDSEADEQNSWIMQRDASVTLQRLHKSLESLYAEKASLTDRLRKDSKTASLCLKWTPGLGHIVHMKGSKAMAQSLDVLGVHRTVSSSKSTRSFHLPSWTKLGARIDEMKLQIRSEEQRIFKSLREDVIRNLVKLRRNAAVLDELDVACSFASLAREQRLTRPILNMGYSHKIIGGRHPTVKLGLEEKGRPFVNNDCFIGGQERIWLITGPNMAGKSTFLRQNALITILAQVGSFVPAEYAELGMVDQIFSRIGAADDLFRDQSTFMVEMLETAAILKHASRRSFVIMDEVGRGTAPEDGIAIGFACLQHLHDVSKCRTLFATHFHSLAEMTSNFGNLGRYCTSIVEDTDGSFSFIHKLQRGVNRNSHALKVARLAGVPQSVIDVAEAVLNDISLMSSQPEARERERSAIVSVKS
ncbi:DNA mismatch repair protein Msh1 [Coccidioides immitis RS]|uniref:DNA mismatch repair protein MSH3 n=3 Tax=Coccidioides immitis TaxID=5501 RepID=J3KKT8_COCIM|nr:DNA mismatch repair protein Msh1 [Coccidioides immitis RS]EAS36825.3 DNA mismatch repair protein Msh1 [Coccidioides immitis RS]KMP09727.1 DNA mismatch repair protein mutS [Coccidioides immitis RMSCC 2394]KMU90180.1 DNA mismatch repair protein mutS [Coccidioides immitis H538.4]